MGRTATNKLLQKARKGKSDEFYTQLSDIERELHHYSNHFKGKVVYCNCDDPYHSNFFKYFVSHFHDLGLKKLIASCYKETENDLFNNPTEQSNGFYCEYTGDTDSKQQFDIKKFKGNGDFRSAECIELLKQADIIVTNPPFSLFREFVAQLVKYDKQYLIIGNINAITYKEIFDLIKRNKTWLGVNLGRGISGFIVPDHYNLYGTEIHVDKDGNNIIATNNCLWLTNLEISQRNNYIELTKCYKGNEDQYPQYDNCEGINVNKTQNIPKDYYGIMGVPITFLHKYNPHQFEIIRFRKGDDGKDLSIKGQYPYFRILIRNKQLQVS